MIRNRPYTIVIVVLHALITNTVFAQPDDLAQIDLNRQNYAQWREHILPADEELKFLAIPWKRSFGQGILEANRQDKPLLLWAMNGHPLGCT